mmetsp:Transcript_37181/g.117021  ORF Transcript_37181/g.117021 Transcript_37181/m.117021 type:complete len:251 (-) Transcript_37181:1600-2352(-)
MTTARVSRHAACWWASKVPRTLWSSAGRRGAAAALQQRRERLYTSPSASTTAPSCLQCALSATALTTGHAACSSAMAGGGCPPPSPLNSMNRTALATSRSSPPSASEAALLLSTTCSICCALANSGVISRTPTWVASAAPSVATTRTIPSTTAARSSYSIAAAGPAPGGGNTALSAFSISPSRTARDLSWWQHRAHRFRNELAACFHAGGTCSALRRYRSDASRGACDPARPNHVAKAPMSRADDSISMG